jgi:hypothetical protein
VQVLYRLIAGYFGGVFRKISCMLQKTAPKCRESSNMSKYKWNFMLLGKSVISIFRNCQFMTKWVTTMYTNRKSGILERCIR